MAETLTRKQEDYLKLLASNVELKFMDLLSLRLTLEPLTLTMT